MYSLSALHVIMVTLVLISSSISLVERLMPVMLACGRLKQLDCPEFKIGVGSSDFILQNLTKRNKICHLPSGPLALRRTQGHMHLLQHLNWPRVVITSNPGAARKHFPSQVENDQPALCPVLLHLLEPAYPAIPKGA